MKLTRRRLREMIAEALELDLEKGDVILTGRFKNKRTVVKDIGTDDLGQPTINGMKLLTFRIEKLMPKDKWSKQSKEALEFADQVNEKRVVNYQTTLSRKNRGKAGRQRLRKIIAEVLNDIQEARPRGGRN